MGFYDEMQSIATGLLDEFQQGQVVLLRSASPDPDPDEPWVPVTPVVTEYPLRAVVRRVEQRYVNGETILLTDDQITFAVPGVTPQMTDVILVDGRHRIIGDLRPVPAAGTPVVWIAFVRA